MESILGKSLRRPDVTFYRSGRIDINSHAAKILKLGDGDVVDVLTHDGDYLLYVRHRGADLVGRYEAQCFGTNRRVKHCNNFRCYSVRLTEAMLHECNATDIARLPIGEAVHIEGRGVAIPLITRNNLNK